MLLFVHSFHTYVATAAASNESLRSIRNLLVQTGKWACRLMNIWKRHEGLSWRSILNWKRTNGESIVGRTEGVGWLWRGWRNWCMGLYRSKGGRGGIADGCRGQQILSEGNSQCSVRGRTSMAKRWSVAVAWFRGAEIASLLLTQYVINM